LIIWAAKVEKELSLKPVYKNYFFFTEKPLILIIDNPTICEQYS